jgi:hypothetical protein
MLMWRGTKKFFADDDSGQMLPEAAIGLSLVVFVFLLSSYSLFISLNYTRTAMAARHAAWFHGQSGGNMTPAQADQWFFYQSGLSKVEYSAGIPISGLVSLSGDKKTYGEAGSGPVLAKVTFGPKDAASATKYPFTLMKTHVPFMPDSMLEGGLSVKNSCQWDEIRDTWTSPGKALQGVFNMLKSQVTKFF